MSGAPLVGCGRSFSGAGVLAGASEDGSLVVGAAVGTDRAVLREEKSVNIVRVCGGFRLVPCLVRYDDGIWGVGARWTSMLVIGQYLGMRQLGARAARQLI